MKIISISCAVLLVLAIFRFPIGYYTFLRIAITLGAILILLEELKNGLNLWVLLFGGMAMLFNPILPIYLYKKSLWIPIDIGSAILFVSHTLKDKKYV